LTEAGQALAPGTREGFEALSAAWRSAKRLQDTATLTVTSGPALTAKWLAPRLFKFATDHPEIELRFSATLRRIDLARDSVDVALRYGYGPDPGLFSRRVIEDWISPMMTPELARTLSSPADLRNATLFHADDIRFLDPPVDWGAWFRAAGIGPVPSGGPRFGQSDHAIDAALAGGGIVLGRSTFAAKALREGRLVAPFPLALTTKAHYRFLCLEGAETRPQVAAFLEWILAEAKDLNDLWDGRQLVAAADVP
ncbi:MAG: LysR substrate-binding domain-containing protein, partial [Pseudomonadota bacterium]